MGDNSSFNLRRFVGRHNSGVRRRVTSVGILSMERQLH
jgi:hypothetical protein